MSKKLKIITGILAGGTLTFIAAPIILPALGTVGLLGAAGTGAAISTLSGAALTSASCAAVTGTVAGTSTVLTTAGAIAGGVIGGISKKREKY